jgi:hypothetical protein
MSELCGALCRVLGVSCNEAVLIKHLFELIKCAANGVNALAFKLILDLIVPNFNPKAFLCLAFVSAV